MGFLQFFGTSGPKAIKMSFSIPLSTLVTYTSSVPTLQLFEVAAGGMGVLE